MTPIEFRTRRKALGLSQEEMGRCIALASPMADGSARPAVKQTTIARWEGDRGLPGWADQTMQGIFDKIGIVGLNMEEELTGLGQTLIAQSAPLDGIVLPAYRSDREFWTAAPHWEGWPVELWNIAAVRTADRLMRAHTRTIILDAPGEDNPEDSGIIP